MNEGSLDGGVEAFKFESLPKLSQTKSADGKTTVLDYIVETFIEKGARETLFLDSDFPDIQVSLINLFFELSSYLFQTFSLKTKQPQSLGIMPIVHK